MNVAELGFSAATQPIKDASKDLRDLSKAAKDAAGAANATSTSTSRMSSGLRTAAAGLPGLTRGLSRAAQGATLVSSTVSEIAGSATLSAKAMLSAGSAASSTAVNLNKVAASASGATGQLDAHVAAWRRFNATMKGVPPAANQSKSALDRLGKSASDNINRMQATPGNVAAQFQDVGVTAAAGMNPMLIALQQGTQLGAAMSGGLANLGKGILQLLSPINLFAIALTAGIALLIQWGMKAFDAGNAADELADTLEKGARQADAFGNAQSMLASLFDITTGKME